MQYWIYWLIVIVVLSIFEAVTIATVSVWFIASALLSLIVSFFIDSLLIQFLVFVIFGILIYVGAIIFNKKERLEDLIGLNGKVIKEVSSKVIGEIEINNKRYAAKSARKIKDGTNIEVISVEDNILVVKRIVKKRSKKK